MFSVLASRAFFFSVSIFPSDFVLIRLVNEADKELVLVCVIGRYYSGPSLRAKRSNLDAKTFFISEPYTEIASSPPAPRNDIIDTPIFAGKH